MKVNVQNTVEVTDEQRVKLAVVLDDGKTRPRREATRAECRDFIWVHGAHWWDDLEGLYAVETGTDDLEPYDDQLDNFAEVPDDLMGDTAGADELAAALREAESLLGDVEDDLDDLL